MTTAIHSGSLLRGIFTLAAVLFAAACDKPAEKPAVPSATAPAATPAPAASKPAADKKLVVGFSQIGAESAWRTAETKSIRSEAEKRGITLQFADAQQKQENQIKAVRSFIAQKVDAIVIAPVVETGWEPVLREAKQEHIPVILVDRGVTVTDESLYAVLVAPDCLEEGRIAGRWLAKHLNGKGNVVELEGTPGSSPAIDRAKGFREAIADQPGIKIIKSQSGDFTRAKGKEVMEAFLKSGQKIDALYAHNDDMALGAIQAIEESGLKPSKDITIISIDAVKGAFEAMAAGKLNCTVECNPLLGPATFDAIEKIKKGETLPRKISLKEQLFEQKDAAALLPERQY